MVPSDYFVYRSANLNPRIKVLLFLDFAQGRLLKNVQNHISIRLDPLLHFLGTQTHVPKHIGLKLR